MINFTHNLAIAIGINNYRNGIAELKTARPDAEKLADLLAKDYKYQVELITDETDRKPTFAELTHLLLEELPQKLRSGEKSRLIFYFAGHGMPLESDDGPRGFLLPQDANPNPKPGESNNFLSMQVLHDALIALPCYHLLIILDCCFAGTFRWASTRKLIPLPETLHREHYDRFIDYPAWQVITSAAHNQEALDFLTDKRGISSKSQQEATLHSPFAQALFDALQDGAPNEKGIRYKKADLTKDGVITASELYLYLRDSVETRSEERQTPGIYPLKKHDRGEYIFHDPGFDPNSLSKADPVNEANNPYRGLNPFEEQHARFFFGRQELTEQLCDRITTPDHPLTVVLGVSGSGKSSLVKAGLIPYLRQQQQEPQQQWQILAPMRPGESPFTALARILFSIAPSSNPVPPLALDFLSQNLQHEVKRINDAVQKLSKQSPQNSSAIARSKQDAQHLTQLLHTWNQGTPIEKQQLIVEHFELLYTLCQTSLNQESEQQQLKQIFQESLNLLSEQLQTNPNNFIEIVRQWSQQKSNINLLLVIDQFEELITLSRTQQMGNSDDRPDESQQFLHLLERSLTANLPYLRIVVTLRSDFEPRFLNTEILKSYWTKARFPVRAMRSDELRQAIEGPASEMALYFEPANLVDRLIDEVGQMPGALPLLSFTLSELYLKLAEKWRKRETGDRALTIDAEFDKEGGVAGSLTRRANEEYRKLSEDPNLGEAAQQTMRRIMLRMLTLEGGETARRRVPDSELIYPTQEESDRVKQVVDRLVHARLLVRGQLETGEPYVEPAHDFLVRGWGTLQNWIDEEKAKETLELQQRLTAQANDWYRNNCPEGLLLPDGDRLKQLEETLNSAEYPFNQRETEFVNRSIQQTKKLRARPELLRKAGEVQRLLPVKPLEGLALAIESIRQNLEEIQEPILSQVQFSLHQALELAREQIRFNAERQTISRAVISHSGKYLLTHTEMRSASLGLWQIEGASDDEDNSIESTTVPIRDGIEVCYKLQLPDSILDTSSDHDFGSLSSSFSHDDRQIIVGDTNGVVSFWDFQGNATLKPFRAHQNWIWYLVSHTHAELIVSGAADGFIGVWDYQGNSICQPFRAHNHIHISSSRIAISPGGLYIASSSREELKVWDLNGNLISELFHEKGIKLIGFYSDSELVIKDTSFKRFKFHSKKLSKLLTLSKTYNDCTIDLDKELIVGITEENYLTLFDWQGTLLGSPFKVDPDRKYDSLIFHPKLLSLLTITNNYSEPLKLWDLRSSQIVKSLKQHKGTISSVVFTPDNQYILSASQSLKRHKERTVCLWDLAGNVTSILKHQFSVSAITCSKNEQLIASFDGSVWLWNYEGKLISKLPNLIESIGIEAAIAFSQNDQEIIVATGSSGEAMIFVWNWQNNSVRESSYTQGQSQIVFAISPDTQTVLLSGQGAQVINHNADVITQLEGGHRERYKQIMAVAFSTDGKLIVTGSYDQSIQLWSREGTPIGSAFTGHQAVISALAFSPDGNYIASADWNGAIRLWDLQGNSIAEFQGHESLVNTLTFSPDGYTLVSGGKDGLLRLWRVRWESWLQLACDRLRYHPVFTNPESIEDLEQREIAIAACETCKKYVWNAEDETD